MTTPEADGSRTVGRGRAAIGGGSPIRVVAAKELRAYLRDPRLRAVWTGGVVLLGIIAASILLGNVSLAGFRSSPWMTTASPLVVLFVGLPVTLNQLGWERNSATFLFSLPIRPRTLLLGKNLAAGAALAGEAAVLATAMAWLTDAWDRLVVVPPLALAAICWQLAVGNLVSVLAPLRLPRLGTDLFAQATEQGCLALGAQAIGFSLIGLLLVVPASGMVLAEWGVLSAPWVAGLSGLWGLAVYAGALALAERALARRVPEIVGAVQTA